MLAIPVCFAEGLYTLFVVLEEENLERMKAHDPVFIETPKLGSPWCDMRLYGVGIVHASAEDLAKANEPPMKLVSGFGVSDIYYSNIGRIIQCGTPPKPARNGSVPLTWPSCLP